MVTGLRNPACKTPTSRQQHHLDLQTSATKHPCCCSTMQAASIRSPMRAAVLGGRFPPVGSFACSTTAFYPHAQPIKQHARLSSVAATRTTGLPRCRPQPTSALPALRTASIRSNSTAPNTPRADAPPLDWNSFFRLRASRRRYSLGSSILTSGATTILGVQLIATQDLESLGVQVMGLDPIVVLGMATAACGAVGWLLGPFLGNGLWGLVNRRNKMSVLIVSIVGPPAGGGLCLHGARKRRSSSTASGDSGWTRRRTRLRTLFPTTTARKSAVFRAIGNGSRTKEHTTGRDAISFLNLHW